MEIDRFQENMDEVLHGSDHAVCREQTTGLHMSGEIT